MSKKIVSVALDEELLAEVDEFCEDVERKRSWLITRAIRNYFEDLDDAEIALKRLFDPNDTVISAEEMNILLGI